MDQALANARLVAPRVDEITVLAREGSSYPASLSRRRITGTAIIVLEVDAEGFTRDLELIEASHPLFGAAAIDAVSYWRVAAPIDPTTARSTRIRTPYHFNVDDE